MYVHWDPKFDTGHPLIDAEHRLLVMLFRKLDVAIKTRVAESTQLRIVQEVGKFVEFHFLSEENLMRETLYPGADAHAAAHRDLSLELTLMMEKLPTHREFPDDLLSFLMGWLVDHIGKQDQLVAQHVRNAPQRPVAEQFYGEYLLVGGLRAAADSST